MIECGFTETLYLYFYKVYDQQIGSANKPAGLIFFDCRCGGITSHQETPLSELRKHQRLPNLNKSKT